MDGEAGGQVAAAPMFFHHQAMPGPPLGRKRDFPWQTPAHSQQHRLMGADLRNPAGNWNPNTWDWDSRTFVARPVSSPGDANWDALRLGSKQANGVAAEDVLQRKKKGDEGSKAAAFSGNMDVDAENLTLKLGGGGLLPVETPAPVAGAAAMTGRPNKRVRAGSPGSGGGSYPMCQVDDCRTDLTSAKDYHRRHKVCELHSKASQALVGMQMQRFCQQCSRFHPLSEFDEGKRSCRRRLAGHNRRRRKTQPEDVSSQILLPGTQQSEATGNLDIINLLSVLARLQGNNQGKPSSLPPLPDNDRLIQLLRKINTSNSANNPAKAPVAGGFDLNVSEAPQQGFAEEFQKAKNETTPTMNLLEALSAALTASSPDAPASISQGSSESSGNDKTKEPSVETVTDVNSHNKVAQILSSTAVGRNSHMCHSPSEVAQPPVSDLRPSLPLQLFGSIGDDSPPKIGSAAKYLSSESSNPIEERSPSSSPPVTQKLFPLHSTSENPKNARELNCRDENAAVELSTSLGWSRQMDLFQKSVRRVEHNGVRSLPYQAGYTSSSASDHSPSSSNSDVQDRTGRIIFKLFGKDPSSLPTTVRTDIMNWLANSPSEMESYIRPGCVVLSVYVAMSSVAWEELEEYLLQRVTSLVQSSESDFWRNGRFLVRTSRRLVSHKDGKIRLSKSWRTWSAPELLSMSPIAVVGTQEVSLVLKGRNLAVPGTKVYCTHMGKYTSKDVLCSSHPGTIYDDFNVEKFDFPGGFSKVFGRCFIEVENGFKGNSFPLIIANASICQELRVLESCFEDDVHTADGISEERGHDNGRPQSREDVLHFLNELGWLFQKIDNSLEMLFQDFSCARFKFLILFSVERDWCALTKTLLDILVHRSIKSDILQQEALEMLSEVHLLNRAVKRKCRKMVEFLLQYSVRHEEKTMFLFPPNMAGPGGITPLHLAASTQDSEEIVDALTNDPQEIGLRSWETLQDDSGQSPYMYAEARNNHSYNKLVTRKITDRKNGQVTICVGGKEINMDAAVNGELERSSLQASSCTKCALAGRLRKRVSVHTNGLLQRPYVHSLLAIAAVCVCVTVFLRGMPKLGHVDLFKWEAIEFGSM